MMVAWTEPSKWRINRRSSAPSTAAQPFRALGLCHLVLFNYSGTSILAWGFRSGCYLCPAVGGYLRLVDGPTGVHLSTHTELAQGYHHEEAHPIQ